MSRAALSPGWGELVRPQRRTTFWVQGTPSAAPPLVLLPSLGGGAQHWGSFGELLGRDRQTVAIDPWGFGRSSAPPLELSTSLLAEEVLHVLAQLQLDSCDVLGLSFGALVASLVAGMAPERVRRLVLASCAARGRDFAPRHWSTGLRLVSDFLTHARPKVAIARDVAVPDGADPSSSRADVGGRGWSRLRLMRFLAVIAAHDASEQLPRIAAPVLVLHGERDAILGAPAQQRLLAELPHAQYRELPEAGHDLVSEAPEACAQIVSSFLSGAEATQAVVGLRA